MVEHTDESVHNPEVGKKKEAHVRFFERWQKEFNRAKEAINVADQEARTKLTTLSADVLRRAGLRQAAYGFALTPLHAVGAGLGSMLGIIGGGITGAIGGGIGGALAGAVETSWSGPGMLYGAAIGAGAIGTAGAIAGAIGGELLGRQIGVEVAGWVYSKFVRKMDPELMPLSKFDWVVGQLPLVNPPVIGGLRNMFEGFFGLAAKREEAALATQSATK